MANKSRSKSAELYFTKYKTANKQAANRKRKLERLLKEQPNNEQIAIALTSIGYRRYTPKTEHWKHSMITTAQRVKRFTGKFDKNMFSADPVAQSAAAKSRNENIFSQYVMPVSKGSMFSIRARVSEFDWGT